MTLEEIAQQVKDKTEEIRLVNLEIMHLAELVLTEHKVNGDTFRFSDADKQKMITKIEAKKGDLEKLVSELP